MAADQPRAADLAVRLRDRAARHPLLVDAGLALGGYVLLTAAVTTTAEEGHLHGRLLGAVANVALVAPLAFRRRAPLATLATVLAVAVVNGALVGLTGGEAAVLVALATAVAAAPSWSRAALPAALSAVGVPAALWAAGGVADRDQVAAGVAALVAAVAVGAAARLARERLAVLADRAAGREHEEAQRTALAIAAERARIARELHDVVAHDVTVMVSLADGAQVAVDRSPERAKEVMAQVSATGREALRELRGLLGVLAGDDGPGAAPQPGLDGVAELLDRVRDAGLHASLRVEGDPGHVDPMAQLTIYRVVQEALTNVLRHATSATRADVRLHCTSGELRLEVVDDGAVTMAGAPGRGLLGMRQRAGLHGADLAVGPVPGGGWRVRLRVPLERSAQPVATSTGAAR